MTRRIIIVAVALAVLVALATFAFAQGQGKGNQPQKPSQSQGLGTMNYGSIQRCLAGLRLTADQQRQINRIRQDAQTRIRSIQSNNNLTAAQKTQRIRTIQQQTINSVLSVLSSSQRQQFRTCMSRQVAPKSTPGTQGRGGMGVGVPGVQLSPQQQQQIDSIRARAQSQIQAVNADRSLTQQQKADRIRSIQSQAHDDVLAVLTPAQRQQLADWWTRRQGTGAAPMPRG